MVTSSAVSLEGLLLAAELGDQGGEAYGPKGVLSVTLYSSGEL